MKVWNNRDISDSYVQQCSVKRFADSHWVLRKATLDEVQNKFPRLGIVVSQQCDCHHFAQTLDDVLREIIAIEKGLQVLEDLPPGHETRSLEPLREILQSCGHLGVLRGHPSNVL